MTGRIRTLIKEFLVGLLLVIAMIVLYAVVGEPPMEMWKGQ